MLDNIFYRAIIGLFLFSVISVNTVYSQTCNHNDKGNFLVNSKGCAPVDPEWEIRYAGLDPGVKVVVNWGDGTVDRIDATGSSFQEVFKHTYPKDEGICTYNIIAYVEANGSRCAETEQRQNITVWDTDNPDHGKLSINPQVFRVCYGNAAVLRFTDNSTWNCFNLNETSTLNDAPRWIQWEYGTGNASNRIPGVTVNGASPSYPYTNTAPLYPVYSSGSISNEILVPGNTTSADIGKEFEVTLRNWNQCNPYDEGYDPVLTTARIIIVDAPTPEFTIGRNGNSNSSPSDKFCPGETVYFRNTTNDNGVQYTYSWRFTGPDGFLRTETGRSFSRNYFSDPGTYTAELTVTDNNAAGTCAATISHNFEIIESPVPVMEVSLDGDVITDFDFCERIGGDFDFSIENKTEFPTGATVKYEWRLSKWSTSSTWATVKTLGSDADGIDINDPFEFTLSDAGAYKVALTAIDDNTDCRNTIEIPINIYNVPLANAEIVNAQDLCVGREVTFNDMSGFVNPLGFADDVITGWKWWFDYNGDPNSLPTYTDKNPSHSFYLVGEHEVRLEVTTKYGCVDDTIFTVNVNPIAEAVITVDESEGCAPFQPTFRNTKANVQPIYKYRWVVFDEDDVIVDEEEQFPDPVTNVSAEIFDTYEFLYSRTDNQDQHYKVVMEAYALNENGNEGCVTVSDPIAITIYPTASAKFFSDYDPNLANCSPTTINFEVDAATKALPFAKIYEWVVTHIDDNGDIEEVTRISNNDHITDFQHTFTSNESIDIKDYWVTLVATSPSGACIQPYTQQIKINPTPSSEFTASIIGKCANVDIDFKANQGGLRPQDYYWTFVEQGTGDPVSPITSPILDDDFTLTFARDPNTDIVMDVTLRTKNIFGCESTGPTQTFTIPRLETFDVKLDTVSVMPKCAPFTFEFENNSDVTSGTEFFLKVQRGSSAPTTIPAAEIIGDLDSQFFYTFEDAGSYLVTLVGSNALDGCVEEDYISLTVHPAVTAFFNPSETTVCPGQELRLNEASQLPALITQKKWTITDVSDPSLPNMLSEENGSKLFHIFDDPGEYEIKLEVQSIYGCTHEMVKNITVDPRPEFSLDYNTTSCDQTFSFEITITDPTTTITNIHWIWGDGNETNNTTDLENRHIYLNRNGYTGSDEYNGTVTVTATTGCTLTKNFTVKLLQDVSTNFLMDIDEGCAPLGVVFTDFSLGHIPEEQEWSYREKLTPPSGSWTVFSPMPFTPFAFSNTTSETIEYEVMLKSKSGDGCLDSLVNDVTVKPQVIADFEIEYLADCSPMEVRFTNTGLRSDVEYFWEWNNGDDPVTTMMEEDIVHVFENTNFSRSRTFNVKLTATDLVHGCTASVVKSITVQPSMTAVLEPNVIEGCSPVDVNILNTSRGISGHNWQVFNATTNQLVAEYSGSSDENYTNTFTNTTFDTIRYQVIYTGTTSSNACFLKDTVEVLVYPEITASFTATPALQNLPNATVTVSNTTYDNPIYTNYDYLWDFGNGTQSHEKDPDPIEYDTYGEYTITLTVTDGFGECVEIVTQDIEIRAAIPEIDFEYNPDPAEGCGPLTIQFTSKTKYVDKGTLLWDFGDNSTSKSSEENPTYTYYEPGEYTVTLRGSNATGVTVKETKEYIINVYDNPRANFRIRQRMPVYTSDPVIFLNESVDAVSYLWDFGDGTTSTEFEPRHAYAQAGDYTIKLIAISALGCADTLVREGEVEIEAQFEVKIPNAFNPNGLNKVFLPKMQGVTEYNLLIFNRWGELLFESKSQEVGWDGYYKGVMSPPDVYIYKLDLKFENGERTSKQGDVTLLR